MSRQLKVLYVLTLVLALGYDSDVSAAQKKKAEEMPQGTPVLWQEPADIESRDLLAGPGGEMKPDLSNVTFLKDESQTGYSVKFRVRDGAGKEWVAKLGNEAQPETAAVRLVWAVGYTTEVNYLAPCVVIKGAPKETKKDVKRCEGDGFANVRFEARPADVKRLDSWSWKSNPFAGSKEFAGLVIMMGLFNNWDLKDDNNRVLYAAGDGGKGELRYVVSDLGATFGKTGNFITHSRNEPEKFVKTKFVEKVEGDKVRFDLSTKNSALFDNITVEQAAWVGGLLARLSDKQLEDAFRAANYTPEEVQMLAAALRERINQLTAVSSAPVGEPVANPSAEKPVGSPPAEKPSSSPGK